MMTTGCHFASSPCCLPSQSLVSRPKRSTPPYVSHGVEGAAESPSHLLLDSLSPTALLTVNRDRKSECYRNSHGFRLLPSKHSSISLIREYTPLRITRPSNLRKRKTSQLSWASTSHLAHLASTDYHRRSEGCLEEQSLWMPLRQFLLY